MGWGLPNLSQYYNRGGGVYRDPKFVLRNKWTAPYILNIAPVVNYLTNFNFLAELWWNKEPSGRTYVAAELSNRNDDAT